VPALPTAESCTGTCASDARPTRAAAQRGAARLRHSAMPGSSMPSTCPTTISFARPRFLNAASENLLREMLTAMYSLDYRDDVGVIVVRGTGPAFSSGFDLAEIPIEQDGSHGIHAHFRVKAL
jgi:Enoyl-CoA hydratase/isomerase